MFILQNSDAGFCLFSFLFVIPLNVSKKTLGFFIIFYIHYIFTGGYEKIAKPAAF